MNITERIRVITDTNTSTLDGCVDHIIEAIPTDEIGSDYFSIVTKEWNTIVSQLKQNESPQRVTIICPTQEIRDYYMMVYNYWHASGKSDRLMSDEWD